MLPSLVGTTKIQKGSHEIAMEVSVGELGHEAIDLPMWKVDQMGGLFYAKRESKNLAFSLKHSNFKSEQNIPNINPRALNTKP